MNRVLPACLVLLGPSACGESPESTPSGPADEGMDATTGA